MFKELPRSNRWVIIACCCLALSSIGGYILPSATALAATQASLLSPIHRSITFTTSRAMDQLGPWNRDIYFNNGTPVGGWTNLTLFSNGAYNFSGHLHDSGATSYNDEIVWGVKTRSGIVYLFTHSNRLHGTFESGSRNDDWNISGTNPALAASWSDIQGGWYTNSVHLNLSIGGTIDDIFKIFKYVKEGITII